VIYEYRRYVSTPGTQPALLQRFEDSVLGLFEKHGMRPVGFWQPVVGQILNELHYMLRWDDMNQMADAWAAFFDDPEWHDVYAETEADGPLVVAAETQVWAATAFSPTP
jgi:hypothetical protein